jgi:fructose-1,6-bisphosphatase/inositol monophosphatase family enzyme
MTLPEIDLNLDQQAIVERTRYTDWESITNSDCGKLALNFVWAVTEVFQHYLANPQLLVTDGLTQSWPKSYTDSPCFGYDLLAEAVLNHVMSSSSLPCQCYSEESGWVEFNCQPDKPYFIAVVDPLDESSALAKRIEEPTNKTYHTQGAAITLANQNGDFVCAALADFQTGEIIFGEKDKPPILLTVEGQQPKICPNKIRLRTDVDGLVVGSLFDKDDRRLPIEATRLFRMTRFREYPQTLGVVALKEFLTAQTHFLIDPYKGQAWYEMAPYILGQQAGGTILDLDTGLDFSLAQLLAKARQTDKVFRVRFVAGGSRKKTEQLSRLLTS